MATLAKFRLKFLTGCIVLVTLIVVANAVTQITFWSIYNQQNTSFLLIKQSILTARMDNKARTLATTPAGTTRSELTAMYTVWLSGQKALHISELDVSTQHVQDAMNKFLHTSSLLVYSQLDDTLLTYMSDLHSTLQVSSMQTSQLLFIAAITDLVLLAIKLAVIGIEAAYVILPALRQMETYIKEHTP